MTTIKQVMSRFLIEQSVMSQFWILILMMSLASCDQEVEKVNAQEVSFELSDTMIRQVTYDVDELLGRFNPKEHPEFSEVPADQASRSGMYLRNQALEAFRKMEEQAQADGVHLKIISATRNFNRQKTIWEKKWKRLVVANGCGLGNDNDKGRSCALEILKYSSMPGTSRHHWGTDIDINSLNNSYFESGKGKKEYQWLRDNGFEFGFCQVYSSKDDSRPDGYEEEKWHWSYIPLASEMTKAYQAQIDSTNFGGFVGDDALPFYQVMKYVKGISTECN